MKTTCRLYNSRVNVFDINWFYMQIHSIDFYCSKQIPSRQPASSSHNALREMKVCGPLSTSNAPHTGASRYSSQTVSTYTDRSLGSWPFDLTGPLEAEAVSMASARGCVSSCDSKASQSCCSLRCDLWPLTPADGCHCGETAGKGSSFVGRVWNNNRIWVKNYRNAAGSAHAKLLYHRELFRLVSVSSVKHMISVMDIKGKVELVVLLMNVQCKTNPLKKQWKDEKEKKMS